MQMGFATMLIDALHAALEHAPHILDRICMNRAPNIFVLAVRDSVVICKDFTSVLIERAFIGIQY